MNFFRRKRGQSLCFHEWRVRDFCIEYDYSGVRPDPIEFYEIGCQKCGKSRHIDQYQFSRMCSTGMIARDSE
ncbi:hypothetical protein CHH99_12455 [Bacillus licheniformis]|nr:hypothetical protein CHH99_12455 [Bacillus licheniformis]